MAHYRSASLFDLDGTLLSVNCSFHFGTYLYKNRRLSLLSSLSSAALYGLHKAGGLSISSLHARIFSSIFQGNRAGPLFALADEFVEISIPSLICLPAREALHQARDSGRYTAIVSSAPDFLVERFAARFGVDGWLGTPYLVDENGCFDTIGPTVDGRRKQRYLLDLKNRFGIDPSCVQAFSDSHLDLPFLSVSGEAVGVNPDRKLRRHCEKQGWRVLQG